MEYRGPIAKQLLLMTTAERHLMRMQKMTISTSMLLRELKTPVWNANAVNGETY